MGVVGQEEGSAAETLGSRFQWAAKCKNKYFKRNPEFLGLEILNVLAK